MRGDIVGKCAQGCRRIHGSRFLRLLVLSITLSYVTACFEPGPLGLTDSGVVVPPGDTTPPPADTSTPPPQDTTSPVDTGRIPDDTGPPKGCTNDAQCAPLNTDDKCAGVIRCIDYSCQLDPATVVECPPPSDPCMKALCVPATGTCVEIEDPACVCSPIAYFGCNTSINLSTADSGATMVMKDYPCGGGGGVWSEHVWLVQAPADGAIKIVDELETELLELFESIEASEASLNTAQETASEAAEARQRAEQRASDQMTPLSDELDAASEQIRLRRQDVPLDLLEWYDRLRANDRVPIAEIKENACSACRIQPPSQTLREIRTGKRVHRCRNCSRFLWIRGA